MSQSQWTGMTLAMLSLITPACKCRETSGDPDASSTSSDATARTNSDATPTTSGGATPSTGGTATPTASSGPARRGLVHNQGPHNSLSPCALQANRKLLTTLRKNPITSEAARHAMEARLGDEDTRGLLQYIISCALNPDSVVDLPPGSATAPPGGATGKYLPPWPGEVGLCSEWASGPPSPECQEKVTACVLARVNKFGKRVVISVRGDAPELSLSDRVPVEEYYREDSANKIPSLNPCTGSATDCGFSPRYVGRCAGAGPGSTEPRGPDGRSMVTLKASTGATIRVCEGLHACRSTDTGGRNYSQKLLPQSGPGEEVTFECPRNGPTVTTPEGGTSYGYYSVLIKGKGDIQDPPAGYPAREEQVFTYREGAFYGNLFNTDATESPVGSPARAVGPLQCPEEKPHLLVGDQRACYSEIWSNGEAHFTDRFCAGTPCFGNTPGPCLFVSGSRTELANPHACDHQTTGDQPYYQDCHGGSRPVWSHPITVYLNHPCDLSEDYAFCQVSSK